MTALLTDSPELKLLSEITGSDVTVTRSSRCVQSDGINAVYTIEAVRVRAEAITPVLKKILEIRPPSRWGLNE